MWGAQFYYRFSAHFDQTTTLPGIKRQQNIVLDFNVRVAQ
jgi:hypothetical protein